MTETERQLINRHLNGIRVHVLGLQAVLKDLEESEALNKFVQMAEEDRKKVRYDTEDNFS